MTLHFINLGVRRNVTSPGSKGRVKNWAKAWPSRSLDLKKLEPVVARNLTYDGLDGSDYFMRPDNILEAQTRLGHIEILGSIEPNLHQPFFMVPIGLSGRSRSPRGRCMGVETRRKVRLG